MDKKFIDMDNSVKHLGCIPRRFASTMPVENIGFLHDKRDRVRRVFNTYNFSFILRGRGDYILRGRSYDVVAPCVITQWPDEPMDYGPDTSWFEVYLIYGEELAELFRRKNFFLENRPVWYMSDAGMVLKKLRELQELMPVNENVSDRVDLLCESMILESLLAQAAPPLGHGEAQIRAAANRIKQNYATDYDYDELAQRSGMSLSTFRRLWLKYIGIPPARYRSQLQVREACRLLVETSMPVKEVSLELGYDDPLYFSRKFHGMMGITPSEYRRRNQPFKL